MAILYNIVTCITRVAVLANHPIFCSSHKNTINNKFVQYRMRQISIVVH